MYFCLLLFYTIATVFQLYHSGDIMYEMRREKPEPMFLPTQWSCKVKPPTSYRHGMSGIALR